MHALVGPRGVPRPGRRARRGRPLGSRDRVGSGGQRARRHRLGRGAGGRHWHNPTLMKLVRMKSGHGDVLLAEGDPEVSADEERLIAEFRRQLDLGMWAAVPTTEGTRREATMVRDFAEVPRDAERVVFFPPAAGG